MKRIVWIIAVLAATGVLSLISCRKKEIASYTPEDYNSWKQTTPEILNYPIPGHETHSRKIYINPLGEQVRTETREGR